MKYKYMISISIESDLPIDRADLEDVAFAMVVQAEDMGDVQTSSVLIDLSEAKETN